jgi:adenosine deaminase
MPSTPPPPEVDRFLMALPKVELHVHLEGSVRPSTFLKLARKNGLDVRCRTERDVVALFRFRDFAHFAQLYDYCTSLFRDPEDFELAVTELGSYAAQQGVRYLEVTFTAGTHFRSRGIPFDEQIDALATGAAKARRDTGIEIRFIVDHVRGLSIEDCYQTAQWCADGRDQGVVALGLGGIEAGRPASQYDKAIRWAAERGVPFVPHAGEAAGPESIWDALQYSPPRLGHGFRAIEDVELMEHLKANDVLLEICPTSNVRTGTVPSLEEHPVRRLWDFGIPLNLNSDDPSMFNTDVLNEYRIAISTFGFTPAELARMGFMGIRAALVDEPERARLTDLFTGELRRLGITVDLRSGEPSSGVPGPSPEPPSARRG